MIPKFSDWPNWLQVAVMLPHALLRSLATWFWWPKTDEARRKFGFVAAYLLMFLPIMRHVFRAKQAVGIEEPSESESKGDPSRNRAASTQLWAAFPKWSVIQ